MCIQLCCDVYVLTQYCVLYLSINTHKQVTEHLCDAHAQIWLVFYACVSQGCLY